MSMKKARTARWLDLAALVLFLYGVGVLLFGCGMVVGNRHLFPYPWLVAAKRRIWGGPERIHHLSPARYKFAGARVHDADAMAPGVTLLTGYWREFDWRAGIRLIDSTGKTLHHWKADPAEIWPKSPHSDHVAGTKNSSTNYIHGSFLFENGDVLFNIAHLGLVRMNAQGDVVWKLPYRVHHSISRDESGNFWVPGTKWIENNPQGRERLALFPGLRPPVNDDFAVQVSPSGEILREISILKVLYDSGYRKYIWQLRNGGPGDQGDILHINDIEPLPSAIADEYPLFNANDLIVSSRVLSAIFVIDIETETVKWLSRAFVRQHDPDFIGGGYVLVFDNKTDGSDDGKFMGGSEIVIVKPGEDQRHVVYPATDKQGFYTRHGGKVQELDNGNLLITEARGGRVFEIDRAGNTVWEWVAELYDDKNVPEVLEGTRYAITPEQVAAWSSRQ